ncbi:hypothetical protein N9Y48_01805 [Zobellia sp.]|nr:hypothetical protein [Zobellia sp.]
MTVAQTDGNATAGEDFVIPSSVIIPANATSATGTFSILEDDLIEETETVTITVGDARTANVSATPASFSFSIGNLTGGELAVGLSWATAETVTDNSGTEISATDLADLVLQIQDASGAVIYEEDGAGFESATLTSEDPDGEYFVVASFFAAEDIPADLNLTSTFDQAGIINHDTFDFEAALNTAFVCPDNFYTLNKITKSGENYTIESIGEASTYPQDISGTYNVISNGESTDDGAENNPLIAFMSTVEITDNNDGTYTLSDGWAGVYIAWYSVYGNTELEPQVLTINICEGTLSASWTDIFGGAQELSGMVNEDGTINITVENEYGDSAEAIYTPQ